MGDKKIKYIPQPVDTGGVRLPEELAQLAEVICCRVLSRHVFPYFIVGIAHNVRTVMSFRRAHAVD